MEADLLQMVLLLLGGCVAGFLAGLFGVGGGIILVPVLLLFYQMIHVSSLVSTHLAFGTSLLVITFASLSSAVQHARNGQVIWKAVTLMGPASVAGSIGGALLAGGLSGKTLRQIFGLVAIVAALRLFAELRKPKTEAMPELHAPPLLLTGVCVGLVSSLAGIGGGVLSVPLMHSVLRFPLKKAFGTSSATIVLTALAAGFGYAFEGWGNPLVPDGTLGYVDWLHGLPLIAGSVPLAALGARLTNAAKVAVLKKGFALLLFVIAFRMLMS